MNNFLRFIKQKKVIVLLITIVGLGVIIFLVFRYVSPFGRIVNYRFTSMLPGAQPKTIFSSGQESVLKIPTQIITTSKSEINLKLPQGEFDWIKVVLKFKPKINEIIFGARGNEKDDFYYQPLYRDVFRDLGWNQIKQDGFTLWQKQKVYESISGFLKKPPLGKKVAFYYPDINRLEELQSNPTKEDKNTKTTITIPLRGAHTLLIKVNQSPLILKVAKQDLNYYEGEDKLKIQITKDGKIIEEKVIEDDGVTDKSHLKLAAQEETVTLQDIDPDIYQVNLIDFGNKGDILITNIEVNQSKVVFKSNIFPIANSQTNFWANAGKLNISTNHDLSVQTVKLNDQFDLKIEQVDKKYLFDLQELTGSQITNNIYKLTSPKNDLIISGDGYFSFTKDAFFLPEIIKADNLNDLNNLENVDYILTTYNPPQKEGDWMIAEINVDLKKIKTDGNELYFSLEVPQIAKYGGELEIDYLEIEAKGGGSFSKTNLSQDKTGELNIFSQVSNWTVEKLTAVGKVIVETFNSVWNWGRGVFGQTSIPTPVPTKTPTVTPTLKSSPTPPSASSAVVFTSLVRVLNGGAEKGAAASVSAILKGSGFTNVEADNADNQDYKGVAINYRKDDIKIAEKIELLLKNAYGTVTKTVAATSAAETVVILGKK